MMKVPNVWSESFLIHSYELDPGGFASITSICNYLQEVAGAHARELGVSIDQLAERNLTWVLARLRVEMDTYPAWREEVTIETWPSGVERLFATREFLLFGTDRSEIGRASSAWLMIDRKRRRPVRMPDFITSLDLADRSRPIEQVPDRLPDVEDDASELAIRIRYSDLDVNGHVNNVWYAKWSVEAVPRRVRAEHHVRSLDVHFRAEGGYGDDVVVRTASMPLDSDGIAYAHQILNGDQELARSQTVWRPK